MLECHIVWRPRSDEGNIVRTKEAQCAWPGLLWLNFIVTANGLDLNQARLDEPCVNSPIVAARNQVATRNITQLAEEVRVDRIRDVMHRTIGKDGVELSRV